MKRIIALLIAAVLLFSAAGLPVFAADEGTDFPSVPQSVLSLEQVTGVFGNLLGRILKVVTFTDESRIKKAAARDAAGQQSDTALFTGEAEQTLTAETWRAVELSFESGKIYADPFNDVTLDLLLYGNGRLYTVPGFWDGGNTWRVRFVCPAAGTW